MCKSRDPFFYFFYTGVIVRARWRVPLFQEPIVYTVGSWSFRLFQEQFVTESRVESTGINYHMYINKEVN